MAPHVPRIHPCNANQGRIGPAFPANLREVLADPMSLPSVMQTLRFFSRTHFSLEPNACDPVSEKLPMEPHCAR
jgi:hypothetical protein